MISSCSNPQRVFNKYSGEYLTVACGKCDACRHSRRESWARRISSHMKTSGLCVFFTLTYDNNHLPLVYYDDNGDVVNFVRSKSRVFYNRHTQERTLLHSRVSYPDFNGINVFVKDEFFPTVAPPHFVLSRTSSSKVFDTQNRFAIAYGPDFQDYIKRLRINLFRKYNDTSFDPSFTYFAVSEYGPETFRPHFHGILFFRSCPSDIRSLFDLLSQTWGKSLCSKIGSEFEIIQSTSGSAEYVSKYVCKDTSLPFVLQRPEFCTKSYKSISIPIGSESFPLSDIPSLLDKDTLLYDKTYYDKKQFKFCTVKCSYPNSSWRRAFPGFAADWLLSPSLLRQLLDRVYQFKSDPTRLPNYTREFSRKYPLGVDIGRLDDEYIKEYIHRYLGYEDPLGYPRLFDILVPNEGIASTYSYFYPYLLSYDIDFFLFGIPANRASCVKILRNATLYDFCSTSDKYYRLLTRYQCLKLSDNIRYQNAAYLEDPSLDMFVSVYADFYDSLYEDYRSYTSSEIELKNKVLQSFNLSLSDFYNNDGILRVYTRSRTLLDFDFDLSVQNESFCKKRLYNYNSNLDL